MTNEEQNIAVAEWMGPNKFVLVDFGNDLNAIHEVEKKLNPIQEADYVDELAGMMMNTAYEGDPAYDASNLCSKDLNYRATASQRREALLRTIGKWV